MPNIREFSAPEGIGLQPSERGVESAISAARQGRAMFNEAAQAITQTGERAASDIRTVGQAYLKFEDHREISQGAAEFAKLQDGLTQQWNETAKNADPNDPTVAAKFREEVLEPALQRFGGAFNTENSQKFAEQKTESLRLHLFQKTAADMSSLAGIAVRKNLTETTTAMSNTAMTDPSSVTRLLDDVDHSVQGIVSSSPTLSAIDAARVHAEVSTSTKKAIVQAGAIGAISKSSNPEGTADEWIKKYPEYISGSEAKMLASNGRMQIRAMRADESNARTLEDRAAKEASDKREGDYFAKLHSDNPAEVASVTAKAIANDYTLTREARERMVTIAEKATEPDPPARISSATTVDLLNRARLPEGDPRRVNDLGPVYDQFAQGKLSKSDFKFLRDEITSVRTPEGAALATDRTMFFKQYTGAIGGKTYDPVLGSPKLYAAEMDARRKEADLRKQGKDPHLLYDPSSEYFFGKPSNLSKYAGSLQNDLETKATTPSINLTGPGKEITGVEVKDAPIAPPAQREAGVTYPTPKGPMKWTGTGWVKP